MRKLLLLSLGVALSLSVANTASAVGSAYYSSDHWICTHSGSNVMLRAGAGKKHRILARMPSGSSVTVLDSKYANDGFVWYKVRYGRVAGWARSDYICSS